MGASGAVFEFAAAESCVRTIPRNVSASATGWDGDFSGGDEAFGDCEHDQAGACVGVGECAEGFAVAEAKDRARSGKRFSARQGKDRGLSAAVPLVGGKTLPAAVVDFSRHSPAVWLEILGFHLRWRGVGCGDRTILG